MLPKFLSGSYKRYKQDSQIFTSWLAEAAKTCGVEVEAGSAPMHPKEQTQPADLPVAKIPLAKFVPLADAIAHAGITIPQSVMTAARRAIALRKRCADWFRRSPGGQPKDDCGHLHFIQVLERVLDILGGTKSDGGTSADASPTPLVPGAPSVEDFQNRFASLHIEDEGQENEDAGSAGYKQTLGKRREGRCKPDNMTAQSSPDMPYEPVETTVGIDLDAFLEVSCLFGDLQDMRSFLNQTWSDYASNKLDLMSASVTTNTAFDLVREEFDEFLTKQPELGVLMGAPTFMLLLACQANGIDPVAIRRAGDPFPFDLMETWEWCLLPTCQLLDSFTRVFASDGLSIPIYNVQGGWYDPKADRNIISVREKYEDDRAFMMQNLSQFAFLQDFDRPLPAQNELTRGVREMCRTKTVTLWVAFAAQIFLDVRNLLRSQLGKGFQDMRLVGIRAKKTLASYFAFHAQMPATQNKQWVPENDTVLQNVQQDVEDFIETDWFSNIGPRELCRSQMIGNFVLYKSHPLLCGLMTFNINLRMQQAGIILMNTWGTGINLAYLYNAVQHEEVSENVQWADMDKLIEFHTEERLFLGGRPRDHHDALKKLSLAMGLSADTFGPPERGRPRKGRSKRSTRGLEEQSVVSKLFRNRYCARGRLDLSTTNVETVLNDLADKQAAATAAAASKPSAGAAGPALLRTQWRRRQRMTPLQLLAALRARLVDEEQSLVWVGPKLLRPPGLTTADIRLLCNESPRNRPSPARAQHPARQVRAVVSAFTEDAFVARDTGILTGVPSFGPQYIENEAQLGLLVPYLLHVAVMSARRAAELGLASAISKRTNMGTGSRILMRAGDVLADFVREGHGDAGVRALGAFCRNKPQLAAGAAREREEKTFHWTMLEDIVGPAMMAAIQCGFVG